MFFSMFQLVLKVVLKVEIFELLQFQPLPLRVAMLQLLKLSQTNGQAFQITFGIVLKCIKSFLHRGIIKQYPLVNWCSPWKWMVGRQALHFGIRPMFRKNLVLGCFRRIICFWEFVRAACCLDNSFCQWIESVELITTDLKPSVPSYLCI